MDTGVTLGSRAPEDVPRGAEVHNNMDHVESSALEYTTLSALNIKATGIESRVAFSQPDSHSSSLAQDVSLQVKATVHPVSGSNELNQSPGGAKSWLRNRSEGSQEEVPPVAATETLHQTGGLKDSVSRHDFLDEESRRSKMGSMLHDLTINLSNNPRSQINSKTKALALMKFEEASQALATQVHSGSHTASLEELQSLIKNGFLSMLNSCATRKRSSAEASLSEPSGSKRKLVACEFCPKKLHRECDLKYRVLSRDEADPLRGITGSIRSVTLALTAAPSKLASRLSAVRMTGNGTKTRNIIKWKHGDVMKSARTESSSVPKCFTGGSYSSPISGMDIRSRTTITSGSNSKDIRSGGTDRRDSGADFVRRLSS